MYTNQVRSEEGRRLAGFTSATTGLSASSNGFFTWEHKTEGTASVIILVTM